MRKVYLVCLGIIPLLGCSNKIKSLEDIIPRDNPSLVKILIIAVVITSIIVLFINFSNRKKTRVRKTESSRTEEGKANFPRNQKNLVDEAGRQDDELVIIVSNLESEVERLKCLLSEKNDIIRDLNDTISRLSQSSSISKNTIGGDSCERDDQKNTKVVKADNFEALNTNLVDGKSDYDELTVRNGILVKVESNDTVYYCSWKRKGKLYFKFVNNERTRKAINNRTVIIDPFCIKQEGSKSPDLSEEIETIIPGVLNEDFTIQKKAEIIYK